MFSGFTESLRQTMTETVYFRYFSANFSPMRIQLRTAVTFARHEIHIRRYFGDLVASFCSRVRNCSLNQSSSFFVFS